MSSYARSTIEAIGRALPAGAALTPREVEQRLPIHYNRSTVRAALRLLAGEGRLIAEGDIYQRRYRHRP